MKLLEGEYAVRMVDFPGDVHGCVRLTNDGSEFPNIYINDRRSIERRCDHGTLSEMPEVQEHEC